MNAAYIDTNFERLLIKCEELAERQDLDSWRFEKYVLALEEMLKKLTQLTTKNIPNDTIKEYTKKVEFLKQLTLLKAKKNEKSNESFTESLPLVNPGPIISKKDMKPKQIYHKVQLNQENILRQQLLGKSNDTKNKANDSDIESVDMKKLLEQQQLNQEKLAQEMLKSVESIKAKSMSAKKILDLDNKILDKLNTEAEKNADNLSKVSSNLTARVSKSCNCWIWLMMLLIMLVFIMMVLFMKLFPKKQHSAYIDAPNYINNNNTFILNGTKHTLEL